LIVSQDRGFTIDAVGGPSSPIASGVHLDKITEDKLGHPRTSNNKQSAKLCVTQL